LILAVRKGDREMAGDGEMEYMTIRTSPDLHESPNLLSGPASAGRLMNRGGNP